MNRAGKRAWTQRMREWRTVAERVRYAIILAWVAPDRSAATVADGVGCARSTALRVVHRYLAAGEAGLGDHRRGNGTRKVTAAVGDLPRRLVRGRPTASGWTRPTWTVALLARQVATMSACPLSPSTIRRLLRQIRARRKRPRPVVRCPWPAAQRVARCAVLRRLWTHPPVGSVVLFEDDVDIHRTPKLGPDWMLVGPQKVVVTPGTTATRYPAGAPGGDSGRMVRVGGERTTSARFPALRTHPPDVSPAATTIHVLLDHDSIHSSKAVQAALATGLRRVRPHVLPPSCPSENRIARCWLDRHANVTPNHQHSSIEALLAAVQAHLTARTTAIRLCHRAA